MSSVLKIIASSIVYSNLWISAGAVSYAYVASVLLQFDLPLKFIGFIFSTTLFTYNFQRLVKIYLNGQQVISGPRVDWVKKNIFLVTIITASSAFFGFYFGWTYFKPYFMLLFIIGFTSFFYVWKLPFLNQNIRSIPGIKIFVLSATWVIATHVLPNLLFSKDYFSSSSILIFCSAFLFICAISIPFDVRDLNVDDEKLKTLPQVFGIKSSIWLGISFLFLSALLIVLAIGFIPYGLIAAFIVTSVIVYFSNCYSDEMYYSGLVDGTLILLGLFVYFF
ncbi:MAG: hypothetical protein AB8B72_09500 [Crocinitomicaceae bacterium]